MTFVNALDKAGILGRFSSLAFLQRGFRLSGEKHCGLLVPGIPDLVNHVDVVGVCVKLSASPSGAGGGGMDAQPDRFVSNMACVLFLLLVLGCVAHLDRQSGAAGDAPRLQAGSVAAASTAAPAFMPLSVPAQPALPEEKVFDPRPEVSTLIDPDQRAQYEAVAPKSVLELQQFRQSRSVPVTDGSGRSGVAALTNINPRINGWFLLAFDWGPGRPREYYHLDNPFREGQALALQEGGGGALLIESAESVMRCDLWGGSKPALAAARATGLPYAALCDGRIFLRNKVQGHATDLEKMTDLLRDTVWKGDDVVGFVRESVYKDAFRESARTAQARENSNVLRAPLADAALRPEARGVAVIPDSFGLILDGAGDGTLALGRWYPVADSPGLYGSVMRAGDVATEIVDRNKPRVNPLDAVEAPSLVYLVAFDMTAHELRFALGTDHPRLSWSPRVPAASRIGSLPGPDGVEAPTPLVTTGMVGPVAHGEVVATFAAGFKREHGGFKWGDLSNRNFGSHYGFIENGAVLSKLQPGLSTLYTLDDGSFGMKTWQVEDNALLPRIAHARQNGVALVETAADGQSAVAPLVRHWGPGNWSGSASAQLRTLRAGACLIEAGGRQYLVYGYFSTATPSAMALVFSAYGCRHALNLDMNAPEHTYMATYSRKGDRMEVRHLVRVMSGIDRNVKGQLLPRFIAYPDNRDLFYMIRKERAR